MEHISDAALLRCYTEFAYKCIEIIFTRVSHTASLVFCDVMFSSMLYLVR